MANETKLKDPLSGKEYDFSPLFKLLSEDFDSDWTNLSEQLDTVQSTLIKHLPADPDGCIGREIANAYHCLQQLKIAARKLGKQNAT